MWLDAAKRTSPGPSVHQFSVYRISVGLALAVFSVSFIHAALGAKSINLSAILSEPMWTVAGVSSLCVIVAPILLAVTSVTLLLGAKRRASCLCALLALVLLGASETGAAFGLAPIPLLISYALHLALLLAPRGNEPWSSSRQAQPLDLPTHWSTWAWIALVLQLASLLHATKWVSGTAIASGCGLLAAAIAVWGPKLVFVLLYFGALLASSTQLGAEYWVLLIPALFAAITQDWLPARTAAVAPIVLFDGVCALCDWGVKLIVAEDQRATLRLAPLQGDTSARLLGELHGDPETMVIYDDGSPLTLSDAGLRIAEYLGGMWRLVTILRFLPRGVRDRLYLGVARNRYSWFGRFEACRVPTPEERSRFLQ